MARSHLSARAEERRRAPTWLGAGSTLVLGLWAGTEKGERKGAGPGARLAGKRERTGRRGWTVEMRKEGEEEKMGRGRIERVGRLAKMREGERREKKIVFFSFKPISKSNSNQFEFF